MNEWKLKNGGEPHKLTAKDREKSLEKRRANATKRKMEQKRLEMLLSEEIEDEEIKEQLHSRGLNANLLSLMIERQIQNALDGNLKSLKFICDFLSKEDVKRIISKRQP